MTYPSNIKAGRMTVVRDAANGGTLELLGPTGTILHSVALDAVSGSVAGAVLTFAGFPKAALALVASTYASMVTSARVRSSSAADVKTGLTVGLTPAAAPAWLANTVYAIGDTRTNGVNQYRVVAQTGASAASGGPTGTGASIVDGSVTWAYVGLAGSAIQLSSLIWQPGDSISIAANPTITHAA